MHVGQGIDDLAKCLRTLGVLGHCASKGDDYVGKKLRAFQGKVTGQRLLPADSTHPKTETSAVCFTLWCKEITMRTNHNPLLRFTLLVGVMLISSAQYRAHAQAWH